jgi:DNA-binding protein H-NS
MRVAHQLAMKTDLDTKSIDELWAVHEEIASILSTKMQAERAKLEKRLDQLGTRVVHDVQPRRPYPEVRPKFRNPHPPHQTWSGRGKQPLWISRLLAEGRILEDLRISKAESAWPNSQLHHINKNAG